jgi:hypothetical protein
MGFSIFKFFVWTVDDLILTEELNTISVTNLMISMSKKKEPKTEQEKLNNLLPREGRKKPLLGEGEKKPLFPKKDEFKKLS